LLDVAEVKGVEPAAVAMLVRAGRGGAAAAFATGLRIPDRPAAEFSVERADRRISVATEVPVEDGKILYVERVSTVSSDGTTRDPLASAVASLGGALATSFAEARAASIRLWDGLWRSSEATIGGDDSARLAARLSVYGRLMSGSGNASSSAPG
jgi:trehalose/maltose hydrolase-like predicted phosphorylase